MKKSVFWIVLTMAALVCALVLAGCPSPTGPDQPEGNVIASTYRFTTTSNGLLARNDSEFNPATNQKSVAVTVGANSISWTGAATGTDSLTGIYSGGGGNCVGAETGDPGTWTFLYNQGRKIGIAIYIPDRQSTGPEWQIITGKQFNYRKNQGVITSGFNISQSELGEDAVNYPSILAGRFTGY